jgi:hypothetical protein
MVFNKLLALYCIYTGNLDEFISVGKRSIRTNKACVEHLNDGGDTDRRIALIGFDNATEVCVDVFIRLPPKLRNNYEIKREDVTNTYVVLIAKLVL